MTDKPDKNTGKDCLRILHLSDFHFRLDRMWDQDPVLSGLADSIRELTDDDLGPELVFFTGDIAYSGKKKEYDVAQSGSMRSYCLHYPPALTTPVCYLYLGTMISIAPK